MSIKIDELDIAVSLPVVPKTVLLVETRCPSLDERKPAIDLLSRQFGLRDLKRADLPFGPVFGGPRGEVHFFEASGGLFVRDAAAATAFKSEKRPWEGLERRKIGDETVYEMPAPRAERMAASAFGLLREAKLVAEEMGKPTVTLDQWAQLDDKGKVVKAGAGTATIRFPYAVDGIPVAGAGAKTLLYAEPDAKESRMTGVFHAWRPVAGRSKLELRSLEAALAAGLLSDPELVLFRQRRQKVRITRLELRYLALPAFTAQRHLFPVFQVEGETWTKDEFKLRFGKFVHAASAPQYAKLGVFAHYLHAPTAEAA
jgi:hypothetical protein